MSTYLNFKSARTEIKTSRDDALGIVEAIVNVTGHIDRQRDMVHPGAFRKAVGGKLPKVVLGHEATRFLGKVLSMRELMPGDVSLPPSLASRGLGGLWCRMQFNLETQDGADMYSNVKGGYVDEWSFMFSIADAEHDAKGIRHIKMVDEIFEVSPVLVGASQGTLTLAAKSRTATPPANHEFARLAAQLPRHLQPKFWAVIAKAESPEYQQKRARRAVAEEAAREVVRQHLHRMWVEGALDEVPRDLPRDLPRDPEYWRPQPFPVSEGVRFDTFRDPRDRR